LLHSRRGRSEGECPNRAERGVAGGEGERSRARYPDSEGFVERDGMNLFYEVYGEGGETIFLLPTWSLVHSRFWKMQIPYFARHFRVLTMDGLGNGRSDRCRDPRRYGPEEFARAARAARRLVELL
jgi:pimeloyl-ACP methyl ester carboxylesterase